MNIVMYRLRGLPLLLVAPYAHGWGSLSLVKDLWIYHVHAEEWYLSSVAIYGTGTPQQAPAVSCIYSEIGEQFRKEVVAGTTCPS